MNASPSPIARALLALVRLYQRSATLRSPRCRFHPTCSTYAVEAITLHGAIRGSLLAVRRIGRCHPFHPGGIDPVPQVLPDVTDAARPTMDTRPAA